MSRVISFDRRKAELDRQLDEEARRATGRIGALFGFEVVADLAEQTWHDFGASHEHRCSTCHEIWRHDVNRCDNWQWLRPCPRCLGTEAERHQ